MDDDAIRSLVTRLARAHSSGRSVIERAAIVDAFAERGPQHAHVYALGSSAGSWRRR